METWKKAFPQKKIRRRRKFEEANGKPSIILQGKRGRKIYSAKNNVKINFLLHKFFMKLFICLKYGNTVWENNENIDLIPDRG